MTPFGYTLKIGGADTISPRDQNDGRLAQGKKEGRKEGRGRFLSGSCFVAIIGDYVYVRETERACLGRI